MHYLPYPNLTTITVMGIPRPSAVNVSYWWQTWSSVTASTRITSTMNLNAGTADMVTLYSGSREDALAETLADLTAGLVDTGALTMEQLLASYEEVSLLETIGWFTGLYTVDELLSTTTLPPLSSRTSRRKVKSSFVIQPYSMSDISELIHMRETGVLNQIEWKAYGGSVALGLPPPAASAEDAKRAASSRVLIDPAESAYRTELYTSDTTPILRGQLFEMHFAQSHTSPPADPTRYVVDALIVDQVNRAGVNISILANTTHCYPGYIDITLETTVLTQPGYHYFGEESTQKLAELRQIYDPSDALSSRTSDYLYPSSLAN